MCISKLLHLVTLGTVAVFTLAMPVVGMAEEPAKNLATPPKLEKLEEGESPAITISKPETKKQITEKREQGKVTEVKVTSGKSTYYLKPNDPPGSGLRGDAMSSSNRGAQWPVLEFDLGGTKKKDSEASSANASVPPPPSAK